MYSKILAFASAISLSAMATAQTAPQYTIDDVTVAENAGPATIKITRTNGNGTVTTVRYKTVKDTAVTTDFSSRTGTITFPATGTTATVSVPITNDTRVEATEKLYLELNTPIGALLVKPRGTISILDDDTRKTCPDGSVISQLADCPIVAPPPPPPVITIGGVTVNENIGEATLIVTRTGDLTKPSAVSYITSNGTATGGTDFIAASGVVNFAAGQANATINVDINDDTLVENAEEFNVTIGSPTNATIGIDKAVVIINSDDVAAPPPTGAVLSVDNVSVNEGAGTVSVRITRTGDLTGTIGFGWSTSNDTAYSGLDYTAASGGRTFNPGQAYIGVSFKILDDQIVEGAEKVKVNVRVTSGVATVSPNLGVVTIVDNDVAVPMQTCWNEKQIPLTEVCSPVPTDIVLGDEIAPTLEGYPNAVVTDHDFMTDLNYHGSFPSTAAPDVVGAYRQVCGANVLQWNDPLVYPGQRGKSHLHDFNGHNDVNAYATFGSMLAAGSSECNWGTPTGGASQRSSYWMPAMLYGTDQVLRFDHVTLYYKRRPKSDPLCGDPSEVGKIGICTEIPNGLKMIWGSTMKLDAAGVPMSGPLNYGAPGTYNKFHCHDSGNKYKNLEDFANSPEALTCKTLGMTASAPNCWDGKYQWKTDRTHLSYMVNGKCPITHKYLITGVSVFYVYNIEGLDPKKLGLACDYMMPTQKKGTCSHTDAWIIWDARVKRMFHDFCIDGFKSCAGGNLGNGYSLIGAGQPKYGFKHPNRLEPIPPMPDGMTMPTGMKH